MDTEITTLPTDAEFQDSIATLVHDLPKPVQDFVSGPERDKTVQDLAAKYKLHVDQAGVFEQAFIFMLLGVSTPEEFVQKLMATGLSQETVNGLVTDVNERVFMRLRDAERTAAPIRTEQRAPAPLVPPPALDYQPAAQILPGSSVPVPTPAPAPEVQQSVPAARTMAGDMETLKHPGNPTTVVHAASGSSVHVYHAPPPPPPAPEPAPLPPPPPPVVAPPIPVPVPPPVAIRPQAPSFDAPQPITKEYGVDPYREPVV